jgi:Fe-S-cluster containining protein
MKAKPTLSNRPVHRAPKSRTARGKTRRTRDAQVDSPYKAREKPTALREQREKPTAPLKQREKPTAPREQREKPTALLKSRDKTTRTKRLPLYREAHEQDADAAPRAAASCTACGLCCSYVAIEVDQPTTAKRATQLLWYIYHGGVSLYVNEDEWMVQFETTCQYLQPDHRCGIYDTRPHICREFSAQDCEVNTGDDGLTFYTAAQFLAHLKQTRPRVHALIEKSFAPPPAGERTERSPFEQRFSAVLARRAALGI